MGYNVAFRSAKGRAAGRALAFSSAAAYDKSGSARSERDQRRFATTKSVPKTKHHPDDVSIGRDEWIRFVDVSGRTENAVDLDPHIRPMEAFWRSLEVCCVSECCGISAHSFWPREVWNAVRKADDPQLQQKLAALRNYVDSLPADCVVSSILNQYFDRTMFSKLLDHVIATVNRMSR